MYQRVEDYDPQGFGVAAMSAIEHRAVDIKGKALGCRVYKLLGGAHRDFLRLTPRAFISPAKAATTFSLPSKKPDKLKALGIQGHQDENRAPRAEEL
jgi:L-alanine-DL-glutamate epimerase-like enolase superfamily enzyme